MNTTDQLKVAVAKANLAVRGLLLSVALTVTGCANNATPYVRPAIVLPDVWKNYGASDEVRNSLKPEKQSFKAAKIVSQDHWWHQFHDPQLDQLIGKVLAQNNNLAIAALTVQRAQLLAGLVDINAIPRLGLTAASIQRNRTGPSTSGSHRSMQQSLNLSASYELDLWGRLSSERDAARWEALATEEDRASAALALIGTTATLYWKLAYLNQSIRLNNQNIATATRVRDLIKVRHQAGAESALDGLQAEQTLATQQAAQSQLVQQRTVVRNALAVLFDGAKDRTYTEPTALPEGKLPVIDTGLPFQIISRRPDLRGAELRLRKLLADTDIARARFYPDITLSAALNGSAGGWMQVLQNPVGTLAANMVLPFVEWDKVERNSKLSQADYDAAIIDFRQKIAAALADVENALSARHQLKVQANKSGRALTAAQAVERIYQARYQAGATPLKAWLDAQIIRRSAQSALIESHFDRLINQVDIYKALGGDAVR
ncbi:efflux transporter outer membrane subunit [Glaciimonas immobilis]|uniref:NodT family efflux transporter outer membrane factor (OMF) lipoprotein n=1 Tax=Glaciimonas immobilis TaxID=728004 RepID=A0A840RVF9_9BURK|nr:efflux transporter outer membrane subunit [Glaciimonas immobilis]KAF3999976.1 efflux transporter outer membrane subunit [Glaciimonas immobilis]MBB5200480.1 NodT family efflux transporter outer membrane factor (OMF) lipoprotein [Glaciimonas immobilis]